MDGEFPRGVVRLQQRGFFCNFCSAFIGSWENAKRHDCEKLRADRKARFASMKTWETVGGDCRQAHAHKIAHKH
jgi:hypothetical protein